MTSAAKIAANRRNARKSTGPRSLAGKMRSRRNAYRHGLAIPISTDIAFADQIERLANELSQNASQPDQCEAARRAASAHLEYERAHDAKVRTINRATQDLQEQKRCEAEHGPALAFARELESLVAIDSYELAALAKRNRALRFLDALTHAYPKTAAIRQCHLFDRPVWAFNINALVNAVFESTPHASGGTWDCPQIEGLRVTVQMQDDQSGIIQFTFAEGTSSTQGFAIVKTGRHGGRQWVANCPKTAKRIEDLYLEKDQYSIGSRYMLALSYCSSKSDQAPAARQVSLQRSVEPNEGTPTLPPQRSELCAEQDPHSGDRPRNQPPDPAILDDYGNGSASTQHPASQHQSGGDLLMQVNPTDIIDGHPTANANAGPLPNKSADAASTTIDNFDLKAGDALAAEGNLDEALAAYLRHKAKCQDFAKRSNPQAAKQLYQVARRIGDLAFNTSFLAISSERSSAPMKLSPEIPIPRSST
jgi:hypothetical protein